MRRSVRRFKPQMTIAPEIVEKIITAGTLAPSAKGMFPWEFIVIDDVRLIERFSKILPRCDFLQNAACLIIVASNLNEPKSALYHQDLAASTTTLLLSATQNGLGSCWIGLYETDRSYLVHAELNLPPHVFLFSMVAVGFLVDENDLHEVNRFNPSVIHYNRW